MAWGVGFLVVFVGLIVWSARRHGRRTLASSELLRAVRVHRVTRDEPGEGWSDLGSRTRVRGLDLLFDHDDDPQAEATLRVPEAPKGITTTFANGVTIRLTDRFETHHVHTGGYIFRITLRGTGEAVGRETRIRMVMAGKGRPLGGRIENDDDTDAAVGGWIEVEAAEVLKARTR